MYRSTENRNIALFGGAFDPPHVGHALAIRQILDTNLFDQVWVAPTSIRPDKVSSADDADRKEMLRLLIKDLFQDEPVVLASHLIDHPGELRTTIDELRYLKQRHPKHVFSVAIGRDQAEALPHWNAFDELRLEAQFLILVRDGAPVTIPAGINATILDPSSVAWMNLSSTEIRNRLLSESFIEGMVPHVVERYITARQLYRKEKQ